MCGEKSLPPQMPLTFGGSPPRVRGKAKGLKIRFIISRITPACAGKRTVPMCSTSRRRDHPRVCGEKKTSCPRCRVQIGSPPRVRGKEVAPAGQRGYLGITPACAGKSERFGRCFGAEQDHPRVCGEKVLGCIARFLLQGSPPRVRGKVLFCV